MFGIRKFVELDQDESLCIFLFSFIEDLLKHIVFHLLSVLKIKLFFIKYKAVSIILGRYYYQLMVSILGMIY